MNLGRTILMVLLVLVFSRQGLFAQSDYGGYVITENQNFDQSSTSTPTADPTTPDQFYANVYAGNTGTILTSTTLAPPAGRSGTVTFTQSGGGIASNQYFASQSLMDSAFGPGTYTLTVKTSTPNTYTFHPVLGTDDLASIVIPQVTNTNWSNGVLVFDPTQSFNLTWNTGNQASYLTVFNSSISQGVPAGTGNYVIAANTLSANTAYTALIQISDSSGNYQRSNRFTIGVNDLNSYGLNKVINYDQTSASTPTLDPESPYQFYSVIYDGTSGTVLSSSTLTPAAGSTGTVAYESSSNGSSSQGQLYFQDSFFQQGRS